MEIIKETPIAARHNRGMKQSVVAKALGIKPTTLCLWEHNQRAIPLPALLLLGKLYKKSIETWDLTGQEEVAYHNHKFVEVSQE